MATSATRRRICVLPKHAARSRSPKTSIWKAGAGDTTSGTGSSALTDRTSRGCCVLVAERVLDVEHAERDHYRGGERRGDRDAERAYHGSHQHLREEDHRRRQVHRALLHQRREQVALGELDRDEEERDLQRELRAFAEADQDRRDGG